MKKRLINPGNIEESKEGIFIMDGEKKNLTSAKTKVPAPYMEKSLYKGDELSCFGQNKKRRKWHLLRIVFVPAIICLCMCVFVYMYGVEKDDLFNNAFFRAVKLGFLSPNEDGSLTDSRDITLSETESQSDSAETADTTCMDSKGNTDETETLEDSSDIMQEESSDESEETFVSDDEDRTYMNVIDVDLSETQRGIYFLKNSTSYLPDAYTLSKKNIPTLYNSMSSYPLVLIIHTHTSEAYSKDGLRVDITEGVKNSNGTQNVVHAGETVSAVLCENGVPTIHCTVIHDKESNLDSYKNAASSIEWILSIYPTIRYIIDIHRSSESEGMNMVRTEGYADGKQCAQIGISVGAGSKNWQDNLSLSLKLREIIDRHGNICKPIVLNENAYNAAYSYYYLTVDMGSCGNTLEEADLSARIFGESLSQIVKN